MRKKDDFYDDGRTIADMSLDSLPFNDRKPRFLKKEKDSQAPELSPKEQRQVVFSGILAGALIASVFIIAGAIFILILTLLS